MLLAVCSAAADARDIFPRNLGEYFDLFLVLLGYKTFK